MKRKRLRHASPDAALIGLIDLEVLCMTGQGFRVSLPPRTLGREVQRMACERLPCKQGSKFALHHMEKKLMLHKTLQQQGIESAATLSCTRIPTNVYDAWRYIMGRDGDESALEGVTRINFAPAGQYLRYLPQTLQTLSFYNRHLNLSRKYMTLPHSLRDLSFGDQFNRLDHVILPSSLQSLSFGWGFDKSLECVTLPSSL